MAVLINRQGGSDCETLAQEFKDFKMGPVIGTRTWGGWVGIRGRQDLCGTAAGSTQPEFGGWDPQGKALDDRRATASIPTSCSTSDPTGSSTGRTCSSTTPSTSC